MCDPHDRDDMFFMHFKSLLEVHEMLLQRFDGYDPSEGPLEYIETHYEMLTDFDILLLEKAYDRLEKISQTHH